MCHLDREASSYTPQPPSARVSAHGSLRVWLRLGLLAQVTDTTTFTDEARRAEVDAWLYETCTQCLQHMVDIVVQFYPVVQPLLARILDLLSNFIR